MKTRVVAKSALVLACLFTNECARPQVAFAEELESVVVTGTRIPNAVADVVNSTAVIEHAEIKARGDMSVIDLLRDTAGIHVVQPSGLGGVSRVFIRSGSQELALLLLDGVRVNDPNDVRGAAFDFSTISLDEIERIEVVRGPQSAIYGSDALTGVINIISKLPPNKSTASLRADVGGNGYRYAAAGIGMPLSKLGGFTLHAAKLDDGMPTPETTFEGGIVSGKLMLSNGDLWDFQVCGRYSDSVGTSYGEDSGGSRLAVFRDTDTRRANTSSLSVAGGFAASEGWRIHAQGAHYQHDSLFSSPGIAPGVRDGVPANGAENHLERLDFGLHTVIQSDGTISATIGTDFREENGHSDGYLEPLPGFVLPNSYDFRRRVIGFFGELQLHVRNALTLQGSVRRDDPQGGRGVTTSKVGFLLPTNDGRTVLRGNWGQGFKLPGYFALSSPLVGNPDLRPERSKGADLSLMQGIRSGGEFTVGAFYAKYADLIDFDPTLFRIVNKDEVQVVGGEISAKYQLASSIGMEIHATYSDISVGQSDTPSRQQPNWRGGLLVRWVASPSLQLNGSWLYVGESFDSSVPTGDLELAPYHRLDITVVWTPVERLDVIMAVDNFLDVEYEEAIGFPAIGRRARIGFRLEF